MEEGEDTGSLTMMIVFRSLLGCEEGGVGNQRYMDTRMVDLKRVQENKKVRVVKSRPDVVKDLFITVRR